MTYALWIIQGLLALIFLWADVTLAGGDVAPALIPLAVGLLSAFVAYGRWRCRLPA